MRDNLIFAWFQRPYRGNQFFFRVRICFYGWITFPQQAHHLLDAAPEPPGSK